MDSLVGQTLANTYRVDQFIGRGGMADVYKVWDSRRSVYLAMKVLHNDLAEDKVFIRRFRKEAETLARLQHPNIVRLYGMEEDRGLLFMLMEYIDGTSLRTVIARSKQPFSAGEILGYFRPACSALYYAHQMGVAHCDVKPANVLIDSGGHVFLSDFGIARLVEGATTTTLVGAGTPAYMAPEQILGKAITPRTDIYALGILLYEFITTGERPFTGEAAPISGTTAEKVRWEHLNARPSMTDEAFARFPPAVQGVVSRCLEKTPERRYQNTADLQQELETALVGGFSRNPAVFPEELTHDNSEQEYLHRMPEPARLGSTPRGENPTPAGQARPRWMIPVLGLVGIFVVVCALLGFVVWRLAQPSTQAFLAEGMQATEPIIAIATEETEATLPERGPTPPENTPTGEPEATRSLTPTSPPPAVRPPTGTPAPAETGYLRMSGFEACPADCDGKNATRSFPEKTKKVYLKWRYENVPANAKYIRIWRMGSKEWARYECTWTGSSSGEDHVTLTEPGGLHSGAWQMEIQVNGDIVLLEEIQFSGSWNYWSPAGFFDTCYGKK